MNGYHGSILTEDRQYVDWTVGDAQRMLAWVRDWRSKIDRKAAPKRRRVGLAAWATELGDRGDRTQLRQGVAVLRWVVTPRVFRNAKAGREVVELVADTETHGVAVGEGIPALTLIDPKTDSAGRLRALLADLDQSHAIPALRGLLDWVVNQRKRGESNDGTRLSPPPDDLVYELSYLVASRRWPGLDPALGAVAVVLEKLSGKADPVFIRSVRTG